MEIVENDEKAKRTTNSKELLKVQPESIHKKFLLSSDKKHRNLIGPPKGTFRVGTSSVLNRVKSFLPELINANEELSKITEAERCELDIENTDDTEKVIEMNISLVNNELLVSDDDDDDETSSEESESSDSDEANNNMDAPPHLIEDISKTDSNKT